VVVWLYVVCSSCFCPLFLPSRALVAPRFVPALAGSAFPGDVLVELGRTFPALVFLRAVAACDCCLTLGSYVAVVLALKALLHSALSLVSLALKDLALPNQTLVDDLVSILWLAELNDYARGGLRGCAAC
jgi:hypothetical protein